MWGVAFSYPMYKDLRDHNPVFSGLIARFAIQASVSGQGQTELANGELVSGNYFEVLGVRPALGRVFSSQDETARGCKPRSIVELWVLGTAIRPRSRDTKQTTGCERRLHDRCGGSGYRIFGVQVGQTPDIFIPITMKAQMTPNWDGLADRKDHWLAILGRLKPGMRRERAEAGIAPEYSAILQSEALDLKLSRERKKQFLDKKILLDLGPRTSHPAARRGQAAMDSDVDGGIGISDTCANLASLLVARGEGRQREIAVRMDGSRAVAIDPAASDREFADFAGRRSGGIAGGIVDAGSAGRFHTGEPWRPRLASEV